MYFKKLLPLLLLTTSLPAWAVKADEKINDIVQPMADAIAGVVFFPVTIFGGYQVPVVLIWLIVAATFFTIYYKFVNMRSFRHGFDLIRGKYDHHDADGEVTHFQALSTALSGTVGLGNIAGVAVAVSLGGAGATFWMIVAGFLGMSTKFVECTLGVKYRTVLADGTIHGGPMQYLTKGFSERGFPKIGKLLAILFAIMCIGGSFGGGNMFQANQSFQQLVSITGGQESFLQGYGWVFGLIVAAFVGITIIGGIKGIAKVTSKLVPFMGIIYVLTGLVIIGMNYDHVPQAFSDIYYGAMDAKAAFGGIVGVLIVGFQRAAFSNEAGIGSAAIAHSAVTTNEPVTEGLVALYEPFIDTVIVCTITALVIGITGYIPMASDDTIQGIELTSAAFASNVSWFPYILTLAVVLFAFSTMLAWSYYGVRAFTFLFGPGKKQETIYNIMFLVFIVIGASMNLSGVILFSDAMIFAMSFPNIIGLYFLAPVVKRELKQYFKKLRNDDLPTVD